MPNSSAQSTPQNLVDAATQIFRQNGFVATTVDEICAGAGVTKGAFFHHFESKEALGLECLRQWERTMVAKLESAPFQQIVDPVEKALGGVEFFAAMFENPSVPKSCLAGTTAQEVSETHPALREGAQACFAAGTGYFRQLLDDACRSRGVQLDTAALAQLWMATLQGSLLLYKASRDDTVIPKNLRHFRQYLERLFDA